MIEVENKRAEKASGELAGPSFVYIESSFYNNNPFEKNPPLKVKFKLLTSVGFKNKRTHLWGRRI